VLGIVSGCMCYFATCKERFVDARAVKGGVKHKGCDSAPQPPPAACQGSGEPVSGAMPCDGIGMPCSTCPRHGPRAGAARARLLVGGVSGAGALLQGGHARLLRGLVGHRLHACGSTRAHARAADSAGARQHWCAPLPRLHRMQADDACFRAAGLGATPPPATRVMLPCHTGRS